MDEFRLPYMPAGTTQQQLQYLSNFLFQTIQQLNWAKDNVLKQETEAKQIVQSSAVPAKKPDPLETFSSIKALIIKSADIVNAYYDEINAKLEGIYVAESDFGKFAEQTTADIKANSTGILQNYKDLQAITGTVNNLYDQTVETNAYIRTGKLGEHGGVPFYGLEVGQTNTVGGEKVFDKFARFTSDRLSFYDQNDTEVAYVSDYKMYISHVHITEDLVVGGYKQYANHGLAFKWVGG